MNARPSRAWIAGRHRGPALAAAAAFLVVAVGAAAVVQAMPTRYEATAVVSFVPRPDSLANSDTVQLIGQKYVVIATSAATMDAAAAAVALPVADVRPALKAELGAGTGNVSVHVTWSEPVVAATAANAVAVALVKAARNDRVVQAELVAPAEPSTAAVKPARQLLRVAGLLAALLAAALAWSVLRGRTRARVADNVSMALR
jgi:uncharacterized protein involved in exopolysaccharide biosynthesis